MQIERMKLANYEAFGELVKEWSRGTHPIPANLDELKEQLAARQVGASIPEWVKKCIVVESDDETWVMRLPHKRLIEDSETLMRKGAADYPVPPIYERLFQTKPIVEDKLDFHAERIGDYIISSCA